MLKLRKFTAFLRAINLIFFLKNIKTFSPWTDGAIFFPIALLPSLLLSYLANYTIKIFNLNTIALSAPKVTLNQKYIFLAGFVSPILETYLLALTIYFLYKYFKNEVTIAFISALFFAFLHGLGGLLWFFGTLWSFFIFSSLYLRWRQINTKSGIISAAFSHMLMNITALCLAALGF